MLRDGGFRGSRNGDIERSGNFIWRKSCSTLAQLATPDEEECGELDELLVELKKQDLPFIEFGNMVAFCGVRSLLDFAYISCR